MFRRSQAADWGKIKIVHCGLDDEYLTAPVVEPADVPRFVCIGRLCTEKGQIILLEAFSRVLKRHPDCLLVLGGDGEMRKEVEERIRMLGISRSVTLTGWLSAGEVRQELQAARTLVLPSFQESLPVVIMEAFACRRPVIATYVGGVVELVEPGVSGWLVPAGSVEALEEAMCASLSATTDELRRMGDAGAARVGTHHAVAKEVVKLIKLFQAEHVLHAIERWLC
jgi:glycosyltransferase involved in cell wall biosynthesis